MISTQYDTNVLISLLREGESLDDLLTLLNGVVEWQNFVHQSKRRLFTRKQLSFFYKNVDKKYHSFQVPKKSGALRTINAPDGTLKAIQRCITDLLQIIYQPPFSVNGYVKGRSVVSNALMHTNKNFVLNIDLQDFFPNIKFGRVSAVLKLKPIAVKPKFAYLLTKYCCYNGALPQGAPTSPVLSNLICQRLDFRLTELTRSEHLSYSRYADDLTFSSDQPFQNGFLTRLEEIIQEEGFLINPGKVRLLGRDVRQEVTGVTVNDKTNVSRKYIRKIRAMLYNWTNLGYEKAQDRFLSSYKPPANVVKNKKSDPQLSNVVGGKIDYLKMVRGADDSIYRQCKEAFEQLLKGELIFQISEKILRTQTVEHQPRQVVSFLRNFKVINQTGFRELLHDPDVSDFDFKTNLAKVNEQMPALSAVLPASLYTKLESFVAVYNTDGQAYHEKYGLLPLKGQKKTNPNNLIDILSRKKKNKVVEDMVLTTRVQAEDILPDNKVTQAAKDFRTQIRIGNDYFHDWILINSLKPIVNELNSRELVSISYEPSEEEFSLNCEFFTDTKEVWKAIRSLLKDLAENPYYDVKDERIILLRSATIKRNLNGESFFATIIYLNLQNAFIVNELKAFQQSRLTKNQQRLHKLADWSTVYQDESGQLSEHLFLASPETRSDNQLTEGITHKLTFYHS
ncbi:reverse transcriptase domain-containing protein [Fibrella aquatilis]|uniref:RNA-directed DNA polymerase n=1 Tax=Fibrella aquatilis TaxID=2817059 RepID=A0A939G9F4_9BACT|nr:reverse transcriptase domain-containing protein [Fibrella aquatilis]MBO0932552.1 RNA-directed DNA polymerase [Fibrella aquatilis]